MRLSSLFLILFSFLSLASVTGKAQSFDSPPPPPTGFNSQTPAPAGLPEKLDLPPNTRMEVKVWRKNPLPKAETPQPDDPRLVWDPDLQSAVFERGESDVHAVFQWEGGRTSEAFIIHNLCFRILSLAYPDTVAVTNPVIELKVGRQNPGKGAHGDFPGIDWYAASTYVGTATLNGNSVLVFAPTPPANGNAFPEGASACLDAKTLNPVWMDDQTFVYTFTYSDDPNVQIDPQGPYLKAVQNRFGHWP